MGFFLGFEVSVCLIFGSGLFSLVGGDGDIFWGLFFSSLECLVRVFD